VSERGAERGCILSPRYADVNRVQVPDGAIGFDKITHGRASFPVGPAEDRCDPASLTIFLVPAARRFFRKI